MMQSQVQLLEENFHNHIEVFEQQNIILENKNKSTSWEDWWNIGDVITSVMSPHKAKERKALKI